MNCQAGDLAVIIKGVRIDCEAPPIVKVLYLAPPIEFTLPDGVQNIGCSFDGWVCESYGRDFLIPMQYGPHRKTRFAVIYDRALRPIRPPAEETASETEKKVEA